TVNIATKLNRTHLITGQTSYLLPCLGRLEVDEQATGPQAVTMEDSTACIHASRGVAAPASEHLLSEPAIVAGIAKATLSPNPHVPWDEWVGNYALVRDAIEATYPDDFEDFNARMDTPGGFARPLPARRRQWNTDTGKANFQLPSSLTANLDTESAEPLLRLMTLRSNDQFNTTVYGYRDRFRGIHGSRQVVMMNQRDMTRLDITDGQLVDIRTIADDGIERRLSGFTAVEYDLPDGCCAGYYPECNTLIPLWQHDQLSKTPAVKSVPVHITAMEAIPLRPYSVIIRHRVNTSILGPGGLVTCRSMAWAARAQCHVSYQKTESRDKTMAHTRRDFLQASLSMAGLSFIGLPAFAQADGNLIVAYNTGVPSWDPTTGPSGVNPKLQPI